MMIPRALVFLFVLASSLALADADTAPSTPREKFPPPAAAGQTLVRALRLTAPVALVPGSPAQRVFVAGVENTQRPGSAGYRSVLLYRDGSAWKMQRCIAASSCVDLALPGRLQEGVPYTVTLEASTTTLGWRIDAAAPAKAPSLPMQTQAFDLGADDPALGLRAMTAGALQENLLLPANLLPPEQPARVEVLQWTATGAAAMERALRRKPQPQVLPRQPRSLILRRNDGILGYDEDGVPFFDKQHPRYHHYYVESSCSRTLMPGCNFANARDGSLRYPVPGASGIPIVDEQVVYAAPVGFVRTEVYDEGAELINVTLPFHLLHPGIVKRWLEETPDSITLHTYGEGTGAMPATNEALSGLLWSRVDEKVFGYMRLHP